MAGWLAGQRTTAQRLNDNAPFTVNYTSITANTAAVSTGTELVAITTPNVTLRNGRAYEMIFKGLYQSTVAADQVQVQLRKASITGTVYLSSFRLQCAAISGNTLFYLGNVCTNTSGADITTTVIGTYARVAGGAGNVTIAATATHVAYIQVRDMGLASDYPGATAIT